jgi:hypothetical protein
VYCCISLDANDLGLGPPLRPKIRGQGPFNVGQGWDPPLVCMEPYNYCCMAPNWGIKDLGLSPLPKLLPSFHQQ